MKSLPILNYDPLGRSYDQQPMFTLWQLAGGWGELISASPV